jgi:Arc/MetJ family transcription regulator
LRGEGWDEPQVPMPNKKLEHKMHGYHNSYTSTLEKSIMRTNIVIDDELMKSAMNFGEFSTKKALVEASLKLYLQLRQQDLIRQYKGKLAWEGDLDLMRQDSKKTED